MELEPNSVHSSDFSTAILVHSSDFSTAFNFQYALSQNIQY